MAIIASLLLSTYGFAASTVDLYGDPVNALNVLKKYSQRVGQLESVAQQELQKAEFHDNETLKKLRIKRQKLIDDIKKDYGYTYVNFNTITYPHQQNYETTIEVVTPDQPSRLRFIDLPYQGKTSKKQDVLDQMQASVLDFAKEFTQNRMNIKVVPCPVYHCVINFDTPARKKQLALFNQAAIKQKSLILNTLRKDPDPERRASAAFLVGHFKNPHEIIKTLLPAVQDRNPTVRNNAMRVIAMTMATAKITAIDVKPFAKALQSPYETDRNKALFVLMSAARAKANHAAIKRYALDGLLATFALHQANNHEPAYAILKAVSGKDFGDKNLAAWQRWAASVSRG